MSHTAHLGNLYAYFEKFSLYILIIACKTVILVVSSPCPLCMDIAFTNKNMHYVRNLTCKFKLFWFNESLKKVLKIYQYIYIHM
jgi:hypothetical protein